MKDKVSVKSLKYEPPPVFFNSFSSSIFSASTTTTDLANRQTDIEMRILCIDGIA